MGQEQSQENNLHTYVNPVHQETPSHPPPESRLSAKKNESTLDKMQSSSTITSQTQSQQSKKQSDPDRMDVPFVWHHGGKKVVVKGSWDNWQREIELVKKLKRGVHQFKFIVDGEWRYAPDIKSESDASGNINNVVDTEEYRAEFEKLSVCFNHRGSSHSYSQSLPNPADFVCQAKTVKPHQLRHFLTYEPPDAKYYKNLEYSPQLPKRRSPGDCLFAPPHSMVFHASSTRRENVGGNIIQTTCLSNPVRHKYITCVYYEYENK